MPSRWQMVGWRHKGSQPRALSAKQRSWQHQVEAGFSDKKTIPGMSREPLLCTSPELCHHPALAERELGEKLRQQIHGQLNVIFLTTVAIQCSLNYLMNE